MPDEEDQKPRAAPKRAALPAQQPAASAPAAPRKTPEQWAEQLGHIKRADPRIPQSVTHADWQHAAADALYGWSEHAYHYQAQPFLLTQEQYEAALAAAARYPLCGPLAAALPPGQERRFDGFRPATARGND